MQLKIETKNGDDRELAVKRTLEELLKLYPCPIFTETILIERKVISHSHPVLTLNTRNTDPLLILQTFVHEQFHWFFDQGAQTEAIAFLKPRYADLGDCNKTGKYPDSFWGHLVVCWNTRNFLQKVLPLEKMNLIYSAWQAYPLTEKFVKENFETVKADLEKVDMVYST